MPSWIEKELKKRTAATAEHSVPNEAAREAGPADRMAALWALLEGANEALPPALRLPLARDTSPPPPPLPLPESMQPARFVAWLRAPNGATLSFTGNALRYVWPHRAKGRRSRNFWVRWEADRGGYRLNQRVGPAHTAAPKAAEYRFDEKYVEHMIRCMVTGKCITARSVRKRRLWIF